MESIIIASVTSLITIIIAVITIRSNAKSTAKQIESIKDLARVQIDASVLQVELEIEKNRQLADKARQEWDFVQGINRSGLAGQGDFRNSMMKQYQDNKPERDYQVYASLVNELMAIKQKLMASKKVYGGE